MSASLMGIPPQIEQQLMALDKQLRDATFLRGMGRFFLGSSLLLGTSLLIDQCFDLNGTARAALLASWVILATLLLWRGLLRPIMQPTSLAALAALVERRHPELRERLTSLVELRTDEVTGIAPGASKLMQELLARQTVKVFDRLELNNVIQHDRSMRALFAGAAAFVLLFVPFLFNPDGYGLAWSRFFAPWGNYAWGATLELKVWEGDQSIARGDDAPVHVSVIQRKTYLGRGSQHTDALWLSWRDEKGVSDVRRLEWDETSRQFTTTMTHIMRSLTYQVTTEGAKSGTYRVEVSDPPEIARFTLDLEPAPYTGLPARILEGVPGEIRVPEFSTVQMAVEFNQPVVSAELRWPRAAIEDSGKIARTEQRQVEEQIVPLILSNDRRSGKVTVSASASGPFTARAKNDRRLENSDPARILTVVFDQPPQIHLEGDDEPVLIRPDEVVEISVDVRDDYGLTAVELHADCPNELKKIEAVAADQLHQARVEHKFRLDLAPIGLSGGQVVTYRIRAVDNRPDPHEVWTNPRLLMTNTSLKRLPDKELASAEKSLEDQLSKVRTEVNEVKAEMSDLHRKVEDESLGKKPESDKSEQLDQLHQAQDKLREQLEQLTQRLADRGMTHNLAEQARQISDNELKKSQEKVNETQDQPARNQLQPLAQAIDHLGNVDRQLAQLEQQLNELNKLEQDLADLSRMAQRAERLADQLDKIGADQQAAATQQMADTGKPAEPATPNQKQDQSQVQNANLNAPEAAKPQDAAQNANAETNAAKARDPAVAERQLNQLKDEGQKLQEQLNELIKKHPELLDAARKDQVDQLSHLAEQAKNLSEQQARLAEALKQAAAESSKQDSSDGMPKNNLPPTGNAAKSAAAQSDGVQQPMPKNADTASKPQGDPQKDSPDPGALDAKKNPPQDQDQPPAINQKSQDAAKSADGNPDQASKNNSGNPNQTAADQKPPVEPKSQPNSDQVPRPKEMGPNGNQSKPATEDGKNDPAQSPQGTKPQEPNPEAPANEPPQNPSKDGQAEAAKMAADQNQAANTKPQSNVGQKPEADPAGQAAVESKNQTSQNQQAANPQRQQGAETAQQQEQIAKDATQQALDLVKETGSDSAVTKSAAEFAKAAEAVREQTQSGQLQSAAQRAEAAARAADETAKQLNPDGQSTSPQSQQAQQLADRQHQVADALKKLANSSDASQGAQMQGQRQLSEAANRLSQQFDQAANSLKSAPLNAPDSAAPGEQARQATEQAQQAMNQSQQANQQNDLKAAAQSAAEAAEKLQQAADAIKPPANSDQQPANSKPNAIPVSAQVANPVTEAVKRMDSAQQELSQCNCSKPGGSGQKPSAKAGSSPGKVASNNNSAQAPAQSEGQPSPAISVAQSSQPGQQAQQENSSPPTSNSQGSKPGSNQQQVADSKPGSNPTGKGKDAGQPRQEGSVADGQPEGTSKNDPQFAEAAQQFRSVAALLRQARGELNETPSENRQAMSKLANSESKSDTMPSESGPSGEVGQKSEVVNRAPMTPDIRQLDAQLMQTQQNWGRLPGQLRTEILQGAGKRSHSEYKQRIKSYFDEISKPANAGHNSDSR